MQFPDAPQFGECRGLRVEVDWSNRRPRLLGEMVVRDDAGNRLTFTLDEIRAANAALFQDRPPYSVQICAPSLEVATTLQREAEAHGALFKEPTDMDVPENLRKSVTLEITGAVDMGVWRAIGKIAFNYLPRVQGAAFARGSSFDEMRRFVRGELAWDTPPPLQPGDEAYYLAVIQPAIARLVSGYTERTGRILVVMR